MIEKSKSIINPNNKKIESFSPNEIIELLTKLNKYLRGLEDEEVRHDAMAVGDMIAPTREVQDKILDYLMNNLKKLMMIKQKQRFFITHY